MVSCILLSAGLSSRFKSPKALARLPDEKTVIERIQQQLLLSKVNEIIVVLGAHLNEIKPYIYPSAPSLQNVEQNLKITNPFSLGILKHKAIKIVYNKDHNFGQTASFKVGLQNISSESTGIMLFPIDYPVVSLETIDDLVSFFLKNTPLILIPSFHNKKGHPPVFHTKLKNEFLDLNNAEGLNSIARDHQKDVTLLPVDDAGVIKSFNTKEELKFLFKHNNCS